MALNNTTEDNEQMIFETDQALLYVSGGDNQVSGKWKL
jgi:hypothetical protein